MELPSGSNVEPGASDRDRSNPDDTGDDLMKIAFEESTENLELLKRALDGLAQGGEVAAAAMPNAHRAFHTLKGIAAFVGGPLAQLATLCGPAEELLVALRKKGERPMAEALVCLTDCARWIEATIAGVDAAPAGDGPPASALAKLNAQIKQVNEGGAP